MSNFADFSFISFEKIIIDEDNETLHGFLKHPENLTYPYEEANRCMQQLAIILEPFIENTHIRVVFHWDKNAHSRKIKCKMKHPLYPLLLSPIQIKWTTQFIHQATEHEKVLVIVLNTLIDTIKNNRAWQNFQNKQALAKRLNTSFEDFDKDNPHEMINKI